MSVRTRSPRHGSTSVKPHGFTLVEVLMALAISAIVMTGLCAAVNATIHSCRSTESMTESAAKARLALGQIERSVRKADAVVRTSATRLDVVDESSNPAAYVYNPTTKQLNFVINTTTGQTVTLARNVTGVNFAAESEPDPETQVNRIVRLTASVTVTVDNESHLFKTSVAPRRARTYQ